MGDRFAFRIAVAFAVVAVAAAAVTAVLVNVAFDARFSGYLDEQQDRRVAHLTTSLAETYESAGGWDEQELDRVAAVTLMDGGAVRLSDVSGAAVWESRGGPMSEMHQRMMGSGPLGAQRDVEVAVDGEVVGTASVRLPQAGLLPSDVAFRTAVNRVLLLAGVAGGLVAVAVGVLLARRATAPARRLTSAARAIAAGDRSRRVGLDRRDEFGEMAEAFDRMAEAVEEEDRLRRTFAADVAHELRTPLMILRGEIEALEDGIVEPTPEALSSLREETMRLGRLVDDLETVARADAAGFTLDRQLVDLAEVVADAASAHDGILASRGVGIEVTLGDGAYVSGDRSRLEQVVVNLLANASAFTPEGGRVSVDVGVDGQDATITVTDSGPGIPPDELDHVFERFFRGRQARPGGSGIGLTVVRDLVEAHRGGVTASNHPGGGAAFVVRLPREDHVGGSASRSGASSAALGRDNRVGRRVL
jgi:two-component system, OmpR family, sensor histidine kinase BaeS